MLLHRKSIVALDVGAQRIGVAVADTASRLPQPLTTLQHSEHIFDKLRELIDIQQVETIIVGLPRNLSGQNTQQTADTRAFVAKLKARIDLPVHLQDEAVTTKQAEAELAASKKSYTKEDVDALAATYILEDYLGEHQEAKYE